MHGYHILRHSIDMMHLLMHLLMHLAMDVYMRTLVKPIGHALPPSPLQG